MKIAAAVVLYNPTDQYIDGIKTYQSAVDRLYIVDNSEKYNRKLIDIFSAFSNVTYLDNHGNRGIAFALNRACKYARHDHFQWLLTMDQDSVIDSEAIEQMEQFICDNCEKMKLGMVSANYFKFDNRVRKENAGVSYPALHITSGSMMNLDIWKNLKGFEDKLFVEQVDFDYSLKCINAGYKLAKLHDVYFEHREAEPTKKNGRVLWNYSPARFYYIGRNHIYMKKKYGTQFTNYNLGTVGQYFEFYDKAMHEHQPIKKTLALTLGIIDAATNHYGKCRWKFI